MKSLPFAPTFQAGKFRGVFVGTVDDNVDGAPANPGFRVRVTVDALDAGFRTFWARVVVPMGGNERGTYFLPQKGEQVLVVFEHGNMNREPIVLGTMWSTERKPPETNPSGKNNVKLIQTPKGHRIIFDDKEGAEKLIVVDSTNNNKIEIDSAAKKVTIQSAGNLKIVATKDVAFHAKNVTIHTKGDLAEKATCVAMHAMGELNMFGPATVTGSVQMNMNPTPACKIDAAPCGELVPVSQEQAASEANGSDAKQGSAAARKSPPEEADEVYGGGSLASTAAVGLTVAGLAAGGAVAGSMLSSSLDEGLAGPGAGLAGPGVGLAGGSGLGGPGAFGPVGGPAGAGRAGRADAGGAAAAVGVPAATPTDAAGSSATSSSPFASPLTAGPSGSDSPQWGTAQAGGVGRDVQGRASASASVSASGVDLSTSSSSSVFQESMVSRATNPGQVPDLGVQVTSAADRVGTAADPAAEAQSHIPALPLEPTPPVVELRSAAAAVAPDSVRSAVDTAGRVESGTSDARSQMVDPELGAETAARSVLNERVSVVHPMGVKGEVNARESTYGDPNMLAKAEVDHQYDRGEAAAKLKVTDEHFTKDVSVSTEDQPAAPPSGKASSEFGPLDPEKPGQKQPDPDAKKPGSK